MHRRHVDATRSKIPLRSIGRPIAVHADSKRRQTTPAECGRRLELESADKGEGKTQQDL